MALLGVVAIAVAVVVEEEAVKKNTKLHWQGRSCLWEEWKRGGYDQNALCEFLIEAIEYPLKIKKLKNKRNFRNIVKAFTTRVKEHL